MHHVTALTNQSVLLSSRNVFSQNVGGEAHISESKRTTVAIACSV